MRRGGHTGLRTLLLGLDAGCQNVLEPLLAQDAVPTLASIFDRGTMGRLESQVPPWTASAWPSLYTGANPGKHGVFGFLAFDDYDWSVVNATSVRELTLWEILDSHGLSSVVVNAPVTYPPPEIDGAVLPGYVAPEDPTCHPEGLLADVRDHVGDYWIYPDTSGADGTDVSEFVDLVHLRGEAFRYLCGRFAPAFGFLQFQSTDTVLHEHPGDRDKARTVYEAVDDEIAGVLEACDPDTVIVASDHGMDSYDRRFRVNDFLEANGYVRAVRGGVGMPTWARLRDGQLRAGHDGDSSDRGLLEFAVEAGASLGLTAQRVGGVLRRLGVDDYVQAVVPDNVIRASSEQVDFAGSRAYVRSRVECGVRINLEGREPDGVVPRDEYEQTRQDLIDLLSDAETPDGDPVFAEVARREAYFAGPYAGDAVDVVTVPRDFETYLTTWLLGEEFERPQHEAWDHTLDGVIAAAGAGIDPDAGLGDAHLFDVAPTVLATLGVPASDRMDGAPLPLVEDCGTDTYPPVDRDADTDRERAVESRLSDLGYLS